MTRLRQEWKVAIIVVAIAICFAIGVFIVRDVNTDLGLTPTTTETNP